jgi:hypothetical protein
LWQVVFMSVGESSGLGMPASQRKPNNQIALMQINEIGT